MGIVYLAKDLQTGHLCALKTFTSDAMPDAEARAEFRREVMLWVNLYPHVNILVARAVREYDDRLYVRMDYVPAGPDGATSLAEYLVLEKPAWDEMAVLNLAIQFCYGMAHAQQHGIAVHRDLKPGNIPQSQQQ